MYKTAAITLPEKIRSKSVAALLAGLVALTALSMTPLTASAGTPLPKGNDFQLRLDEASMAAIRAQVDRDFRAEEMHHLWRAPHGICVGDSEHQC
jgi:hypothetical protein